MVLRRAIPAARGPRLAAVAWAAALTLLPMRLDAQGGPGAVGGTTPEVGWIGVSLDIVTGPGSPGSSVTVAGLIPGGPGERAGLRLGDRLVSVNGLHRPEELASLAERLRLRVGDSVRIVVEREGVRREVVTRAVPRPAAAGARGLPGGPSYGGSPRGTAHTPDPRFHPDSVVEAFFLAMESLRRSLAAERRAGAPPGVTTRTPRGMGPEEIWSTLEAELLGFSPLQPYLLGRNRVAGAEFVDLTPELAAYFPIRNGVLVVAVMPGTPAHLAGLRPGDVIARVADGPVRSVDELRSAVAGMGATIPVTLVRGGVQIRLDLSR